MALFRKKKAEEEFKKVEPQNIEILEEVKEPEVVETPQQPMYAQTMSTSEQQLENAKKELEFLKRQIELEKAKEVQPTQTPQPQQKPSYIEVPVDISDDGNQRLWNWENNRMLKELIERLK